jgi:transposase
VGRIKVVLLSNEARQELEQCFRQSDSAAVRMRSQIILLKSGGRKAEEIASILGCDKDSVHNWVRRYESEGLQGLFTKTGRGRKPIFNKEEDTQSLLRHIEEHRQSLAKAKAAYEAEGGKHASQSTLRAFLKALATPIKGLEDQ